MCVFRLHHCDHVFTTRSHFYLGIYELVSSKFIISFVCISQSYNFDKHKQTYNEKYAVCSNLWKNIYFFFRPSCSNVLAPFPKAFLSFFLCLILSSCFEQRCYFFFHYGLHFVSIVHCLRSLCIEVNHNMSFMWSLCMCVDVFSVISAVLVNGSCIPRAKETKKIMKRECAWICY